MPQGFAPAAVFFVAQGHRICHCEEAEGRRGALSAKREEVPLGCNLGEAVAISPIAFLRFSRVLRDCHVGLRPPRNDKLDGIAPMNLCRKYCHPAGRSLSAIGSCRYCSSDSVAQGSRICHCEAPKGPWRPEREARGSALGVQSREGSCVFADGFPVIRPGTARLPRRFAPRNDTSGRRSDGNGAAHRIGGTTAASRTGGACPAPTGPVRI